MASLPLTAPIRLIWPISFRARLGRADWIRYANFVWRQHLFGGTTISAGVLKVANDGNLGAATGTLTINNAVFENTAAMTTNRAVSITGQGATFQTDGDLTLTGAFDASAASSSWTKLGAADLIFDTGATGDVGTAALIQAGKVIVKGNMSGDYTVGTGGSLEVTGQQNGDIMVANGGMLMGGGSIGNNVTMASNSVLQGASGQTMAIGGNLTLNSQTDINVTLGLPRHAVFSM